MCYTNPNWRNSFLVTIDTQNDFTLPNAPAKIEGTLNILPKMKKLLNIYRKYELPIIHVIRLYKPDGSNVDICRREAIKSGLRFVTPDTEGAELVAEITPNTRTKINSELLLQNQFQLIGKNEWVMYKPRWGAFYNTNLEHFLRNKKVDTIVFSGCNFPNCPRTSIYQASERDFRIVMVKDAMSQVYEKGIEEMKNIGVNILEVNEIQDKLQEQERPSY
ncbi:cysteine hydrolase family protein [Gracilibacillus kekensis]|uniref:Nicotinamidase-related amidase n=1 Tax=Gracilibacillus kekensis TaxID=1027249 RepID=A0A1M7PZZ5_9BACI|nr:isochorismatase family cysteine hydrolase [Gracilibacillus kekensis]SHN23404.1 Nicotinamidase-related amidase [Gracilibacillus kekensis]